MMRQKSRQRVGKLGCLLDIIRLEVSRSQPPVLLLQHKSRITFGTLPQKAVRQGIAQRRHGLITTHTPTPNSPWCAVPGKFIFLSQTEHAKKVFSSYTSLQTLGDGGYACWRYVTAAETMSMVAWGTISESDSAGYVTGTYGTMSPISMTVVQPTRLDGSQPWVYAPAIQMVVSSSGASTNPTTTAFSGYGDYTGYATPFHIGPLNTTYSIVVVVVAGLFCLAMACCCCYCCCCRSRPKPLRPYVTTAEYVSPYTQERSSSSYVSPAPTPAPVPVPALICPHDISDSCCSTINNPCCACADKRFGKMSREVRVQPYCIFCNLYWKAVPISMCPSEWELLGPRCAHNQSGSCEGEQESNSCCACLDRRRENLDLDFRVSNYCPPCRRVWEMKQPKDWPAIWGRPPVQPTSQPVWGGSSRRSLTRKPTSTPTPKPPKQDQKALSKEIELNILSQVSKGPEIESTEFTESVENDGLRYGPPTLQVSPNQSRSQSGLPPSSVASAATVSASIETPGSSQSSSK
jgi:hypothetical protein